jgi:hypothetical protein
MATKKKAVQKKAVKKPVAKAAPRKAVPAVKAQRTADVPKQKTATIGAPVKEVFTTTAPTTEKVSVAPNSVLLYVNGTNKGTYDTSGKKLGDFVVERAKASGIRSFSVYVDDRKADTSDSDKALTGVSKIEIVSKDARG